MFLFLSLSVGAISIAFIIFENLVKQMVLPENPKNLFSQNTIGISGSNKIEKDVEIELSSSESSDLDDKNNQNVTANSSSLFQEKTKKNSINYFLPLEKRKDNLQTVQGSQKV